MSKELGEGLFYLAHAIREIAAQQNLSTFHSTRAINNFRKYTENQISTLTFEKFVDEHPEILKDE